MEFAGDAGLGGGDLDEALGPVGFEERLLFWCEGLVRGVVPEEGMPAPSARAGFCSCKGREKSLHCQVARIDGSSQVGALAVRHHQSPKASPPPSNT